jgi:hypothetical protein
MPKKIHNGVFIVDAATSFSNVHLEDLLEVPSSRKLTSAGMMLVPCAFARTGSQMYDAAVLGFTDRAANEKVEVFRDEKTVFSGESMESFRSAPVTLGHPVLDGVNIEITSGNSKDFQVGMLEGLPVRNEDQLTGTLVISDQAAIDAVNLGTTELSAGYTRDIELVDGKAFQRNVRANHIAIVKKGRAGRSCRIADAEPDEALAKQVADLTAESAAKDLLIADHETETTILKADLAKAKVTTSGTQLELDLKVTDLVDTICQAKMLVDELDYKGKDVLQIRTDVLKCLNPKLVLDGKDPSYINARFDILIEDAPAETPMGILLRKNLITKDDKPVVDPVVTARNTMIDRQK